MSAVLDDPRTKARATDPATSHAAAAQANFAAAHRGKILAALAAGPATAEELSRRCGLRYEAVSRRLSELERAGQAEPTGETRMGSAGRAMRVWRRR